MVSFGYSSLGISDVKSGISVSGSPGAFEINLLLGSSSLAEVKKRILFVDSLHIWLHCQELNLTEMDFEVKTNRLSAHINLANLGLIL